MKFSIAERMNLLAITPERGSLVVMRLLREFSAAVGFSEEEIEEGGIQQDGDVYNWDLSCTLTKEIEVGPALRDALLKRIDSFGEAEQATDTMLILYDRFEEDRKADR